MIYMRAAPKSIQFSDCDMRGFVKSSRILSWFEDFRFAMTPFVGVQNFLPKNQHLSTEKIQIENPYDEAFYLPVLKLKYREFQKIKFGEEILLHTQMERPKHGQMIFHQFITDLSEKMRYVEGEYAIGIVGTKSGLKFDIPKAIADQINRYFDGFSDAKHAGSPDTRGEDGNFS